MSRVSRLEAKGLIKPPKFLSTNIHYETIMGSVAYGVSADTSDMDLYGFCIPPKDLVWPHLAGEIPGFGTQIKKFEQYQQHHVLDQHDSILRAIVCPDCGEPVEEAKPTADFMCHSQACGTATNGPKLLASDKVVRQTGRIYDISIYSIVKYFHLCMQNNPNMIDSLFTPTTAVQHITRIGQMVRDSRKIFLHKGAWHTFKGYAYQQMHKIDIKDPTGKRRALIDKHGYDTKYGYHLVRLLNEIEQILTEGDLDLQRNTEQLKAIRRGEWPLQHLKDYFARKEVDLEALYQKSTLRWGPDEPAIKQLLLNCLEEHYGSLAEYVVVPSKEKQVIVDIQAIIDRSGILR